jgi:hypothetical protein
VVLLQRTVDKHAMSHGGKKLKENFVASEEANAIATPIGN